jgi:ArsR family transcriptional regulator
MKRRRKQLTDGALTLIAARFRLLAEPMRLKILHTLGDEEMTVTGLVEATGAGQANVSKHLGMLLDAGIVGRRKEGLNTYYRVTDDSIFQLCEAVCSRLDEHFAAHQDAIKGFKRR